MGKSKETYLNATGNVRFNMTNDYLFRYVLQSNEKVLRGLICSLLHLDPKEIKSTVIKNPIKLDEEITAKEFVLDIEICLNNDTYINLEMQVVNKHNWTDRSLSYLCRTFDQLQQGQEYNETLPVIHVGFLDYTLFPDSPEFYATYKMMNIKNYRVYNDKFILSVVDLTQIELATEEDNKSGLAYWAKIFKAKTWEEIKMLVHNDEYLKEAAESIYVANEDEIVRQKCRAREEAERFERTMLRDIQRLQQTVTEKDNIIAAKDNIIAVKDDIITQQEEIIRKLKEEYQTR